jgi:Arc/MetJ-type ribon-helix-helix transcriptional regulator
MSRVIVPLSLPIKLNLAIEKRVKNGKYASKSEYVRDLVREDLLLSELEESRKEYGRGRYFEFTTKAAFRRQLNKFSK